MLGGNSVFAFCFSEFVIRIYEYGKYRFECLGFSAEASASASQYGDVMPDVSIDTFDSEGVVFISDIADMPSRIHNIYVTPITVRAIVSRFRGGIDNRLYPFG